MEDIFVAMVGAWDRQGCCDCEFLIAVPSMITVVPVIKHVLHKNPRLFNLEEVYINQWSPPLDANGDGIAGTRTDRKLSKCNIKIQTMRAIHRRRDRDLTDAWPFAGHYPYPTKKRKNLTVVGVQYNYGTRNTLLTHTCHSHLIKGYVPRSPTASWGMISVYLQEWNSYHPITAYVEVNLRKDGGVEHPMWIVMDRNSYWQTSFAQDVNKLFAELGQRFIKYLQAQEEYITPEERKSIVRKL
uniref:Uncharacterized protein n=2 Tax=Lotharella globosa TaxID=91324 RepID=A0A7S4DFX1_9EUKA